MHGLLTNKNRRIPTKKNIRGPPLPPALSYIWGVKGGIFGQFVQGSSFFPDAPVGNVSSALVKQHVQADLQRPPPPFAPGGSALLPQHLMALQQGPAHQHHLGPVPGVWDVGSSGAVTFSLGGNLNSSNPGFVLPNGHGAQDPRHHSRGGVGPTQRPAKGHPSHPYQRPY